MDNLKSLLLELLLEIADTPYSLDNPIEKKRNDTDKYVDYIFETDTKRKYYIRFSMKWVGREKQPDQKYNWATELTFFPLENSTTDDTEVGGENFGKILATVIACFNEFIKDYKPEYVFWKGIVGSKEDKSSGSLTKRQRIYNTIMDREASKISGYDAVKDGSKSGIIFKGEIPIKGSDAIFDYPEQPSLYDKDKSAQRISRFNLSR